jgi:hypothetical protein
LNKFLNLLFSKYYFSKIWILAKTKKWVINNHIFFI